MVGVLQSLTTVVQPFTFECHARQVGKGARASSKKSIAKAAKAKAAKAAKPAKATEVKKTISKEVRHEDDQCVGGLWKGFNLVTLQIPKEAWPCPSKSHKGRQGYTVVSSKTGAASWCRFGCLLNKAPSLLKLVVLSNLWMRRFLQKV